MISPQPSGSDVQIIHYTELAAYSSWGAWLKTIRNKPNGLSQERLTQEQVALESQRYFRARHIAILDRRMYGSLERDGRVPLYSELEPLFLTFVEWYKVEVTELECRLYVHLAQKRITRKRKKAEEVSQQQWDDLEKNLLARIGSKRSYIRLVEKEETRSIAQEGVQESPDSRRLKAIAAAVGTDTSHLLEREQWAEKMLALLSAAPRKKVVVTQASMGAGKTHAEALLIHLLMEQPENYYVIPYSFENGAEKKPEDHLEVFLATVYADLTFTTSDDAKHSSIEERVKQVVAAIKSRSEQGQKVVMFVDDAQEIFPTASEWSPAWMYFFEAFVREPHAATLFLMTRTWPGWPEQRHIYVEEGELPELSPQACITIWQRYGYDDVPAELLEKVSHRRCGWNPQAIEMLAYQNKQRRYSFGWDMKGNVSISSRKKRNPNEERLEALLDQEFVFDVKTDRQSRLLLQQAITSTLSHQATSMLECLAVSPLGLPLSLLDQEFPRAYEAYGDLINASLVDLNAAEAQRAMIVPLVREAQVQRLLADGRYEDIEARITDLYTYWLNTLQDYRDDAEKAALIADVIVRFIRRRQLLKAADLVIRFGWLCVLFGHIARIQRVFEVSIKEDRGKEETVEHEVGRLLLSYHTTMSSGQKISISESDRMYQEMYDIVVEKSIQLQPHTAVNILHNMLLKYLDASLFEQANQLLSGSFVHQKMLDIPEVHASYLHSKSRLFARWYEQEKRNENLDEAHRLLGTCVSTLNECIAQWRKCLKNALPLQEHYYHFRLARALNDYAYRQRLSGNLIDALEAIEECIRLKKVVAVLPQSQAVSLSEYSQILALLGKLRLAEQFNGEAVQLMERAIDETGNTALHPELGMLLKERADIYLLQARLDEALPTLQRTVALIGERKSRQNFREKAEKQVEEIQTLLSTTRDFKLDKKWIVRFHDLALYDDLAWLAHAGPFTDDEQDEWKRLSANHGQKEVSDRLDALIVQSRQREFIRSQEGNHVPCLWYPNIPLAEVQQRLAGFEHLQKDIQLYETNTVVRMLYCEKIQEEITILRRCEAIALKDQETVWKCDLLLYGKPTENEMTLALQPLCAMLLRAKQHPQAEPLALDLLSQLQSWNLSPQDIASVPPLVSVTESRANTIQSHKKQAFSYEVVRQFFQDVFEQDYQVPEWDVRIAPARDDTYVDINSRTVFLPPISFSLDKVRELLAEEIETHAYRAMSGQRSPLALLGLGLAHYGPTEEGLANHRIQQVSMQIHGKRKNKPWMGTLRSGLASGVMTPALSFTELYTFLEKAFLANSLSQESTGTREELLAEARDEAWIQAARAFRGVPNLQETGYCSLKDRIYLQGHVDVMHFLEAGNLESLLTGKIGVQHVETLTELNILKPYFLHRNLALSPNLLDRLSQYRG